MSAVFANTFDLDYAGEADRRFNRILLGLGLPLLAFFVAIPWLNFAGLREGGGETIETRYVTLQPEAEPAAIAEEAKPQPEDEKPEEKQEEQPKQEKPQPTQQQVLENARAKAQSSGLLAMSDQLAALRESPALTGFETTRPLATDMLAAKSGTGASGGSTQASQSFADAASKDSGGISTPTGSNAQRRTQSGTGLDSRKTTVVETPIGFGRDKTKQGEDGDKRQAGRTQEEIQIAFDRAKSALNIIITRAVRENPDLRGNMAISFVIQPNGLMTDLKVISSIGDPEVDKKLLARIQLINFGPKDVPSFSVGRYPLTLI